MTITTSSGITCKVPNWLVLLGVWSVVDIVVESVKIITKKKNVDKDKPVDQ